MQAKVEEDRQKRDALVKAELDKLTRLLCEATSFMTKTNKGTELAGDRVSQELKEWFKEHQELDEKRR